MRHKDFGIFVYTTFAIRRFGYLKSDFQSCFINTKYIFTVLHSENLAMLPELVLPMSLDVQCSRWYSG